jgi:hypothetical protein
MPAFMRTCIVMLLVAVAGVATSAGCGKEIGDPCTFSTDCSPNGDRLCDIASNGGYCTIQGCDLTSTICPDEAVCVQFFHGYFSNLSCDPAVPPDQCVDQPAPPFGGAAARGQAPVVDDPNDNLVCCSLDELCSVAGHCVPRSSEARFCMKKCGSDGDCRDGYECRDFDKMIAHGGQPVLPPGEVVSESSTKFCAQVSVAQ